MNSIKFTNLWDKLSCPSFTTIRSWNQEKEDYYRGLLGSDFQVWKAKERYPFNKEHVLFHAWLHEVMVLHPDEIPMTVLEKDVQIDGIPDKHWMKKIRKMDKAIVLTFSKSPYPMQKILESD